MADQPDLVPRPPPPDWTVESEVRQSALAEERALIAQRLKLTRMVERQRQAALAQRSVVIHPRGTGPQRIPERDDFEIDTACKTVVSKPAPARAVEIPTIATLPASPPAPRERGTATARVQTRAEAHTRPARVGFGAFLGLVVLLSLALGSWQTYWSLRATEGGRAFLDETASFFDAVSVQPIAPQV